MDDVQARSWEAAVARYKLTRKHRAPSSIRREDQILKFLAPHVGGLPLAAITRGKVEDVRAAALQAGQGPRAVNYALQVLRYVLRAAVEWEWIPAAPRIRLEKLPPPRLRWLTIDEAERLAEQLTPQMAAAMWFTLATGLRKATLSRLEWSMVDWEGRRLHVPPSIMKARNHLIVPLDPEALAQLRQREGTHPRWVFSYRGGRLRNIGGREFREAVQRAGLRDFHWHDLRHTWASWHVQSGTSLAELKDLGGWKTLAMVLVYAHLAGDQLAAAAARMHSRWQCPRRVRRSPGVLRMAA